MAETIRFKGFHGDHLTGRWHVPDGDHVGTLVVAHCFTCSKDLTIVSRLASQLCAAGYAVLRFDFTGLGESEGSFETSTFAANVGDLIRASVFAVERAPAPLGLIGHSLGGAAALVAAPKIRALGALATIGAPAGPKHVTHLIAEEAQQQAAIEGCAFATIAGRTFPISKQFLDDLERFDSAETLGEITRPILVLHSPSDDTVSVTEGEKIFARASQPKSFVPLVGADHLLSDPDHISFVGQRLISWFGRML